MTRASAANAEACPGEGARRRSGATARRVHPARAGWAPSAVSVAVVMAIVLVTMATVRHLAVEHDLALSEAAREVDMRATLIAARLNAALAAAPQASPAEIFRRVLEARPDERLDRAVLVDRAGRRIAGDPLETGGAPRRTIRSRV